MQNHNQKLTLQCQLITLIHNMVANLSRTYQQALCTKSYLFKSVYYVVRYRQETARASTSPDQRRDESGRVDTQRSLLTDMNRRFIERTTLEC